jgi:DNA-binding IclR family transcriptional regulator
MTVNELARASHIAPSTAHTILAELQSQGAVIQDRDRRYRLGPASFYVGATFARNLPIYRCIWNDLTALARELSLTAVIALPWEEHHLMVSVHQHGDGALEVAFGGRVPLDAGSFGKAFYAWSGSPIPTKFAAFTSDSITNPTEYKKAVVRAREDGYSTDKEEFTVGVGAVATAVTSETGYEGLASLIGGISQMNEIGFDIAGRRLGGLAARTSFGLGDMRRLKTLGAE